MAIVSLSSLQQCALEAHANVALSAGAGTGKTRVLVERYVQLFLRDPALSIENVVALTFTNKAAAEMKFRIRARLAELLETEQDPQRFDRIAALKDEIAWGYISTIHAFCGRLLREFPAEAGVDPAFETLDEIASRLTQSDAIEKAIVDIPTRESHDLARQSLEMLLRLIPRKSLTDALTALFEHRFVAEHWCHYYVNASPEEITSAWRRIEGEIAVAPADDESVDDAIAAQAMKALAIVYREVRTAYELQKGAGLSLDFDDLLERAASLLENHPRVARELSTRFRHILIDEFHDTDPQQWSILRHFLIERDLIRPARLFIVGDPKQSIYGFRNADVRVFSAVRDEIVRSNKVHLPADSQHFGDLRMNVNYRSRPAILVFVNYLFQRMMKREGSASTYAIDYEKLECSRDHASADAGAVELIFLHVNADDADPVEQEAEAIARRIVQIVRHGADPARTFGDVAILLRKKTKLKTYEAALRKYDVPYIALGGLGFYERQELYDVRNMLRFLFNELDDLALLGALRSEMFALSDELLYKISTHSGRSLWEKLLGAARSEASRLAPPEREIAAAAALALERSRADSRHSLPSEFLRRLFDTTGYWTALAAASDARQRLANVEKLISIAQRFEASGFVSLLDFLDQLDLSIEGEEREGEAQTELDALNAVRIMTIHAAKGLEFPVVIIPHLTGQINYGARDAVWIDPDYGLALKIADPAQHFEPKPTRLRSALGNYARAKISAEEIRLLYVAATRARDHLILCASTSSRSRISNTHFALIRDALSVSDDDYERGFVEFEEKLARADKNPTRFRVPIIRNAEDIALPEGGDMQERGAQPLLNRLDEILTAEDVALPGPLIFAQPLHARPEAEVIAITDLQSAALCPARYFFERILGAAPDELSAASRDPQRQSALLREARSFAMRRGSLIHHVLEESHTPAARERQKFAENLLDSHFPGITDDSRAALLRDVLRTLEEFEKSDVAARLARARTILRELPFRLNLNGGWLSGKIDCLFQDDRGRWEVIDFKTDRISRDDVELHSKNYDIQMRAYALFAASLGARQEVVAAGLYYSELNLLHSACFNQADLTAIRSHLERLFKRVAAYRDEINRFAAHPLRDCIHRVSEWCEACEERDAPRCARGAIRNLLELIT